MGSCELRQSWLSNEHAQSVISSGTKSVLFCADYHFSLTKDTKLSGDGPERQTGVGYWD